MDSNVGILMWEAGVTNSNIASILLPIFLSKQNSKQQNLGLLYF